MKLASHHSEQLTSYTMVVVYGIALLLTLNLDQFNSVALFNQETARKIPICLVPLTTNDFIHCLQPC